MPSGYQMRQHDGAHSDLSESNLWNGKMLEVSLRCPGLGACLGSQGDAKMDAAAFCM